MTGNTDQPELENPAHRLVRASDVSGLPVVSIDSGEDVAEIRDVVFNGHSHRLVGFTLNKRGWFRGRLKERLEAEHVHAIGPDAVMVANAEHLTAPDTAPSALTGDEQTNEILGNRALSADGNELGTVTGVVLSTATNPQAVGYEIENDDGSVFVPISAELALSDDNLLLPASATDFIVNDLTGFGAAVQRFRAELDERNSTSHSERNTA